MKLASLAVLLVLSACKKAPEETKPAAVPTAAVVAGVPMIDITSEEAKFSCLMPADWGMAPEKALDPKKGLAVTNGKLAWITITKYPEMDPYTDARAYAESLWELSLDGQPPAVARDNGLLRLHYLREPYPRRAQTDKPDRYDVALVPVKGGFYQLQHRAPSDSYDKTLPVFEAVVRSFKPLP